MSYSRNTDWNNNRNQSYYRQRNTDRSGSSWNKSPHPTSYGRSNGWKDRGFSRDGSNTPSRSYHRDSNTQPLVSEVCYDYSSFEQQSHSYESLASVDRTAIVAKKPYRVYYDPELRKDHSKGKTPLYKTAGGSLELSRKDPRRSITTYPHITNSKGKKSTKRKYKSLLPTDHVYNSDSIGPKPSNEIVVWGFPTTTADHIIKNLFASYGSVTNLRMINDPVTAVPLGIACLCVGGEDSDSYKAAKKAVHDSQERPFKIAGHTLKVGVNVQDQLRGDVVSRTISKNEDARRRQSEAKQREIAAQNEKVQKAKAQKEMTPTQSLPLPKAPKAKPPPANLVPEAAKGADTLEGISGLANIFSADVDSEPASSLDEPTKISSHEKHVKDTARYPAPEKLQKYIKGRPYILIPDKYIPVQDVSANMVMKSLEKYPWKRVLTDHSGFYVVFDTLKDAEDCFDVEDGRKFLKYRMYMDLLVPRDYLERETDSRLSKKSSTLGKATGMVMKELESFLLKDIKEKIVAPEVILFSDPDRYPHLMEMLQQKTEKPPQEGDALAEQLSGISIVKNERLKLPTFKKRNASGTKSVSKGKLSKREKMDLMPMSHALNFEESEDEGSLSPKRADEAPKPPGKRQKIIEESSSEEEEEEEEEESAPESEAEEEERPEEEAIQVDARRDYSKLDPLYRPLSGIPVPVAQTSEVVGLRSLQATITDNEDFDFLKKVFFEIKQDESIKNIDYWAWRSKNIQEVQDELNIDTTGSVLDGSFENGTGSARSEGYTKMADSKKADYLPHRRKLSKPLETIQHDASEADGKKPDNQSSRVNRAKNRRFAADISAQKQMLGSETDILNLNQLTKRKKPVSFARSAIHNWGLYALEPIAANEMIIEYVGESLRQQVAELRERQYLKSGIGSSYLFRIDEHTVIDATKKGGIARFINHCCVPSCTAKIIKVEGKKRIVIYALRDIAKNEELTYDYKFERETNDEERVPCLCGVPGCKGFLN